MIKEGFKDTVNVICIVFTNLAHNAHTFLIKTNNFIYIIL